MKGPWFSNLLPAQALLDHVAPSPSLEDHFLALPTRSADPSHTPALKTPEGAIAGPAPGEGCAGLSLCTRISGTQGQEVVAGVQQGISHNPVPHLASLVSPMVPCAKGRPTSSCSSTHVPPACTHVLPSSATAADNLPVLPGPLCSPVQRPWAFLSPAMTNLLCTRVVRGLGRVPRQHLGRDSCSESPEGCREWNLHKRVPRIVRALLHSPPCAGCHGACQQEGHTRAAACSLS